MWLLSLSERVLVRQYRKSEPLIEVSPIPFFNTASKFSRHLARTSALMVSNVPSNFLHMSTHEVKTSTLGVQDLIKFAEKSCWSFKFADSVLMFHISNSFTIIFKPDVLTVCTNAPVTVFIFKRRNYSPPSYVFIRFMWVLNQPQVLHSL